jgi:hypothetical protein
MFFSPAKKTLQGASQMGFRSLFVLMKLGFDMREHYSGVLDEPLPDDLIGSVQALAARESPRPQ